MIHKKHFIAYFFIGILCFVVSSSSLHTFFHQDKGFHIEKEPDTFSIKSVSTTHTDCTICSFSLHAFSISPTIYYQPPVPEIYTNIIYVIPNRFIDDNKTYFSLRAPPFSPQKYVSKIC